MAIFIVKVTMTMMSKSYIQFQFNFVRLFVTMNQKLGLCVGDGRPASGTQSHKHNR